MSAPAIVSDLLPIDVRPIRSTSSGERRFVVEASCHARQPMSLPWTAWEAMYSPAIYDAMNHGVTMVADVGGLVVGFVVVKAGRLFMLYVKEKMRGEMIGVRLLKAAMPELINGPTGLEIPVTGDLVTPSFKRWCDYHGMDFDLPREG